MLIKDSKHNKVFITTPFGCITIKDTLTNNNSIMTADEEKELLRLTKENNFMLKQIYGYLSYHIANANQENIDDFIRNILANVISNSPLKRE